MMITGSLKDPKMNLSWPPELWTKLVELVPQEERAPRDDSAGYDFTLGWVTLKASNPLPPPPPRLLPSVAESPLPPPSPVVAPMPILNNQPQWLEPATVAFRAAKEKYTNVIQQLWPQLLCPFMQRNGQLPYIYRQPWFFNHQAEVDIEVIFYWNRPSTAALSFHKDTGGDNLFFNLIFNNDKKMLATEWIEDLKNPSERKREEMTRLMPQGMSDEITAARTRMQQRSDQPLDFGTIRGGIAPEAAFVSAVDDLVWHASPSEKSRTDVPGYMYYSLLNPQLYWAGDSNKITIHRALLYLSTFPDTAIAWYKAWWKKQGYRGFATDFVDGYIDLVVPQSAPETKGRNFARHMSDVSNHASALENAPISLGIGQELASDSLVKTIEFNKRTGIRSVSKPGKPRTKRANSILARVLKGYKRPGFRTGLQSEDSFQEAAANYPTRSFLRTWVRVRKV
jgi:hypothetical protein